MRQSTPVIWLFVQKLIHGNSKPPKLTLFCWDNGWTLFHNMYENSTLCTKWFVHQANATAAFIVHQANAAEPCIVHQGNVVEHFGSYIMNNGVHSRGITPPSITGEFPIPRAEASNAESVRHGVSWRQHAPLVSSYSMHTISSKFNSNWARAPLIDVHKTTPFGPDNIWEPSDDKFLLHARSSVDQITDIFSITRTHWVKMNDIKSVNNIRDKFSCHCEAVFNERCIVHPLLIYSNDLSKSVAIILT